MAGNRIVDEVDKAIEEIDNLKNRLLKLRAAAKWDALTKFPTLPDLPPLLPQWQGNRNEAKDKKSKRNAAYYAKHRDKIIAKRRAYRAAQRLEKLVRKGGWELRQTIQAPQVHPAALPETKTNIKGFKFKALWRKF